MSAFAQKEGGMLTDEQVNAIIHGIRERWSKPNALAGVAAPPYAAKAPGNPQQGEAVYATFCASCHGTGRQRWAESRLGDEPRLSQPDQRSGPAHHRHHRPS